MTTPSVPPIALAGEPHDLSTSAGGRAYVSEFFSTRLRRHDFGSYISERLAADFACVLAKYLSEQDAAPTPSANSVPVAYWWKDMKRSEFIKAIGFEAPSHIPTSALNPLYDAAPPASHAPNDASKFLSESDMAALFVFHSQAEDHEADGYTVDKEKMKRLAELGVVNSRGFGRYETTAFGAWLVETDFEQNPTLPLRTVAEYNEIALLQANGATK